MKKIVMLCLLVSAACAVSHVARGGVLTPQGGGAESYFRDGARLALEGRLAEAAHAFEQAVALDPSNGNAYYGLGNVYAEQGRWADAVNAYYKAVNINKDDVEALNNLGVALSMRGQHVQAAAAFQKAVKVYPKWAEPHYHLGEERRALGQEDEAREAFERALRLRPDYASRPPRPFSNTRAVVASVPNAPPRGRVLDAMKAVGVGGGDVESEKVASTAPTATPLPSDDTRNAAASTVRPGASAETNSLTSKAAPSTANAAAASTSASPEASEPARAPTVNAASPYDLGVREARAGRHREAVAAFREAVAVDRRNAAAFRALGDEYAALGSWSEAVDAYEQAARLAPEDAETYQKLGRSYARLREAAPADGEGSTARANVKAQTQPASTNNAAGATIHVDPDPTAVYRVGPGDVLDIRLPGAGARRNTSYEVTPTGLLDYPTLKEPLAVAGLTVEEVAARLGEALRSRATGAAPEVAVGVREYVSHAIIVGGMVKEPGTKIIQREGVPLYVIVAHAQPLADAGEAVVVSRATGRETVVELSDEAAMKTLVRQGDVVTLRARTRRLKRR